MTTADDSPDGDEAYSDLERAILVEHGADPHYENVAGRSPHSLATEYDVAEILEALERA